MRQYNICSNTSYNMRIYIADIETFNKKDSN
jgi:hypothetical protein